MKQVSHRLSAGFAAFAVWSLLTSCAPAPNEPMPSGPSSAAATPTETSSPVEPTPTPTISEPPVAELPDDLAEMAGDLGLTEWAATLLASTEPVLTSDESAVRDACQALTTPHPGGALGGCFTSGGSPSGRIYVYRVDHPELAGTHHSVLAHELLHAVWYQMEPDERTALEGLLEDVFGKGEPEGRQELLESYRDTDRTRYVDELHSYLGTEVETLPPALETHYATVFQDRAVVVGFYEQVEEVLRQRKADLERRSAELEDMKSRISAGNEELARLREDHAAEAAELETLRADLDRTSQEEVDAYNQRVDELNAAAQRHETRRQELEALVAEHDARLDEYNRFAEELNALYAQRAIAWD